MKKTSLCLNMIVKNESHIIVDTLTKLLLKIKFDYYVISDTGSTDDTKILIKTFFDKMFIPGEIWNDEWKDFGYNRSLALNHAFNKTDYLFIFDADDYISGEIILPDLNGFNSFNSFMLKFGNESNAYERMCLVKNNIIWKYIGVLHEYITTEEQIITGHITGNYFIVSGRTSSRNNDPNKYIKDAEILEKGYYESLKNEDNLHNRYVYYCANSYLDAGNKEYAIKWYNLTLKSNGWFDERYNACLKLYELTNENNYLVQSFHHNPRRVEGIYYLIRHYTCENMHSIAMGYYNFIKNYYENEYLTDNLSTKLFANVMDYTFYLPYYMVIVCEKLKDYTTGLKMFEIIFEKMTIGGQWWADNLLYNLQFFNYSSLTKLNDYLLFLEKSGIKINYNLEFLKKPKVEIKFKFDVLIYTGFAKKLWNYTYSMYNAMGGSERAVIYLSNLFPKEWKIVISGDVEDEVIGNIHYINRFKIDNTYQFDTIIVSRYVSFFTIYPYFECDNIILMAHDTHFMNNLQGCEISPNEIIEKNKLKIKCIVYLTEWQKDHYHNLHHPELKEIKNVIINNGIQLDLFSQKFEKLPNTFIYTSGSFRGLKRLLELWPLILIELPNAKLNICSYEKFPKSEEDYIMDEIIKSYDSIIHLGKLNQIQLYNLMDISEYWLYPCCFNETSCITALEMLMSKVICLYYPIAGLTDTIKNYGIQVKEGNEIETIKLLTQEQKVKLKIEGMVYAESCSWKNRVIEWKKIIKTSKKKIVLYARPEFPKIVLDDYINSLQTKFIVDYKTSITEFDYTYYDELIYVHETYDRSVIGKFKEVNYLNTEPLNLECRLLYIKQNVPDFMIIYDYSLSNIKILNDAGITNTKYFEYLFNEIENTFLKEQKEQNKQIYDFGIICSAGNLTNDINTLEPPRRKEIIKHLLSQKFKINIISGFGKERDIELSKCKTILNIHGQYSEISTNIFEHIRCNRLLDAGYNILSEESYFMDPLFLKKDNLKFKKYDSILKMVNLKIVDCFTFYNELDLLEYRLNLLYNIVDYFILVEATLTHTGNQKELYYNNNKELFKKWNDKIIHIIVDDFPFKNENLNNGDQWKNEKFQRNCITRGLILIENIDLVIISDLDEIPDPNTLMSIKYNEIKINNVCQFEQDFYYYNLESKMDHQWYFSKIINLNWFLTTELTFDDIRLKIWETIPLGGWHLSYFGNSSFISNKIKNFAHQEYNQLEFNSIDKIEKRIKNGIDIYDRDIKIIKTFNQIYYPPGYKNVYCFIHSCNLGSLKRLNYLKDALKNCGINFNNIFINNIGISIENGDNYSDDPKLFEIPTINKMIEFSTSHPRDSILYLHTKGVLHPDNYQELNNWIDLMLYFLLKKDNKGLLNTFDCIGCNYKNDPLPHFSGNFWWSNCDYLSSLPFITTTDKNDAEYHLFKNNPKWKSLHNSTVNHYHSVYPKENYQN